MMPFFALFRRKKRAGSFRRARRPSVNDGILRRRSIPIRPSQRALPVLPAEVVLLIFQFAARDSPSEACKLALLCSQTRDRVRSALYTQPTLVSARQINLFLRTVKRAPDLARLVTRLRLCGGPAKRVEDRHAGRSPLTTRLATLLELCPALEALELRRVVVFSLTDFANARRLRHLALVDSLLSDRTSTSRFVPFFTSLASLQTLSLSDVHFDGPTASLFLSKHTLPHLRALALSECRLVHDPESLRDLGHYNPTDLADQLELLCLTGAPLSDEARERAGAGDPFDLVWRCSSALRRLEVPVAAVTPYFLESTSRAQARPRTLAIIAPDSAVVEHLNAPVRDLLVAHLVAAQALSAALLALPLPALSQVAPPADGQPSAPLGSSLSPSSSLPASGTVPAGSAAVGLGPSAASTTLMGGMRKLELPASWDPTGPEAWKDNGELGRAVARLLREGTRRGVTVRFGCRAGASDQVNTSRLTMLGEGEADVVGRTGARMLAVLEQE